jgi:hypothetical protein
VIKYQPLKIGKFILWCYRDIGNVKYVLYKLYIPTCYFTELKSEGGTVLWLEIGKLLSPSMHDSETVFQPCTNISIYLSNQSLIPVCCWMNLPQNAHGTNFGHQSTPHSDDSIYFWIPSSARLPRCQVRTKSFFLENCFLQARWLARKTGATSICRLPNYRGVNQLDSLEFNEMNL